MNRSSAGNSNPPTGQRGARLVAAANLAVIFMGSTLITPLYPLYQHRFGFAELTLTLVYAVYVVGNLAALFFLGRLSDQIGRRVMSLAAIVLACAGTIIFLLAGGTVWLFPGRILIGLATGVASGTCTAWITDLTEESDKSSASVTAAAANMLGVAFGPLIAGLLAQYAPAPLRLSFWVYLLLLIAVALFVRKTRETVKRPIGDSPRVSLEPRIGIPREIRVPFIPPAATAFATFALGGFYAALAPTLLIQDLHRSNLAIGGDIVFNLFLAAAVAVILTKRLDSRKAMLAGLMLMIPSLALLGLAQEFRSLPLLVTGSVVSGVAVAMGYRGSLQVVTRIAPGGKRAEVLSGYMMASYLGNSVPVVGIGVVTLWAAPETANLAFAVIIALMAAAALATGSRPARKS